MSGGGEIQAGRAKLLHSRYTPIAKAPSSAAKVLTSHAAQTCAAAANGDMKRYGDLLALQSETMRHAANALAEESALVLTRAADIARNSEPKAST